MNKLTPKEWAQQRNFSKMTVVMVLERTINLKLSAITTVEEKKLLALAEEFLRDIKEKWDSRNETSKNFCTGGH